MQRDVTRARAALRLPRPAVPAPSLPAGSNLDIPGLSSFITPNGSFYRVDTALILPQVEPSTWRLRIHGMVRREVTITFAELLKRPLIEDYVTLTCVSDPVGGPYRRQRQVARRQPVRPDPAGAPAGGRESAAVHLGRRVHLGYPAAGRA